MNTKNGLGVLLRTIPHDDGELRFYKKNDSIKGFVISGRIFITIMFINKNGSVCHDVPLWNHQSSKEKQYYLRQGIEYIDEIKEEYLSLLEQGIFGNNYLHL